MDKFKKRNAKNWNAIQKGQLEEDFALEIKAFSEHWEEKINNY